jgi:hypothetical protein
MTQVCRDFKALSDDERLWQYIWTEILPTLRLPADYPMTKVETKPYKWLCQSKLVKQVFSNCSYFFKNVYKEGQTKCGPGTFVKDAGAPNKLHENKYSGDWKSDLRDGYGTFYWCTGSWYIGEWSQDKREGFGTRVWPNGNK